MMETKRAPYIPEKYTCIAWFNADQRPLAEAMLEHLKSLIVVNDHWPRLATWDEVKDKLDSTLSSGELVIVIAELARQFSTSMQQVSNAREDFLSGWRAYEKIVQRREADAELTRQAKEDAKPKFAIIDDRCAEYAVIEGDSLQRSTYYADNATTWKTKAAAAKAKNKYCSSPAWRVVNVKV